MKDNLKMSDVGLDLVKKFEGFYADKYVCPAGFLTIGYGHLWKIGMPETCTEEQAEEWLAEDLVDAEKSVKRLISLPLTQHQFDALVSFTFNCGGGALQRSTLRSKLNRGEYENAADEFKKWVWGGGRKLPGLVLRRQAEHYLFELDYVGNGNGDDNGD